MLTILFVFKIEAVWKALLGVVRRRFCLFERVENELGGGADVAVSRRMAAFRTVKKEDVAADFLKRFGEAFRGIRRNDFVATAQRKRRRFLD